MIDIYLCLCLRVCVCVCVCVQVFLDWACGPDRVEVKHTDILEHILLDWHVWCRSNVEVWKMLLWQLEQLLSPDNSHSELNHTHFMDAEALKKILLTSKVCGILY